MANVQPSRSQHDGKLKTIYTFDGNDGAAPIAGLIAVGGTLYGTTEAGGTNGEGTVFSLTPSGKESVVHSFSSDGAAPGTSLLEHDGVLYGTTMEGPGTDGDGTAFALKISGDALWSYDFKGGWDGSDPDGTLFYSKGALYGTTVNGGNYYDHSGSFYRITESGKETVLYDFQDAPDGSFPRGNLLSVGGALYGTTEYGGGYNEFAGTVFKISLAGSEKIVYRFKGGDSDGEAPVAGLALLGGAMYGTTYSGGSSYSGTVFSVTTSGAEKVLHNFAGSGDGSSPEAPLLAYKGNLYGTTAKGGKSGFGIVFAITPAGKETVLHSFSGADGSSPEAGLIELDGTLYGTTSSGGSDGDGTVFAFTP